MNPRSLLLLFAFVPWSLASLTSVWANDWPSWRGPAGDGKAPEGVAYPVKWSATENIAWRIALPGRGNSSPVVSGDRVFVTQSEEEGRKRSLLCFQAGDGQLLWKKSVEHDEPEPTHQTNPMCSASPVTDGSLVVAWHSNAGLYAYDLDGVEKWHLDLGTDYAHIWGPNAASPVFMGNALLVHAGPGPKVALFGIDKRSGKIVWKQALAEAASADAKEYKGSWATPLVIDNGGRAEMLLGLPGFLTSFDPKTGKGHWRVAGLGDLCYTNVLTGNGRALYLCGFGGPGMGIRLPGAKETGDLTSSHRLWVDPPKGKNQNPQRIGSGQIVGDHFYVLNEPGVLQCSLVETGEMLWRERLGSKSWSSMALAGGKLYVNDALGTTHVVEPDPAGLKVVSANPVDVNQHTNASLAFAGGRIYLRTDAYLYAID